MTKQKKNISEKEALQKIQKLCSLQEKCKFDVEQKLLSWNISSITANKIIEELVKSNFINESRYAIAFVKDKFRFNKWGKIKISYALFQKRIPEEIIQSSLEQINEEEYLDLLKNEIEKKLNSLKELDNSNKRKKLLSFLSARGFENGKVFDMLNKVIK